jgi:hypothetical protein
MRKTFPVFPVPPFEGDEYTPPYKGNTGIGVYETAMLFAMHALICSGQRDKIPFTEIINEASKAADAYVNKVYRK